MRKLGKRAWSVELGGVISVVAATSRREAFESVRKAAAEIGYRGVSFSNTNIKRALKYDEWADCDTMGLPQDPTYCV
jgi:hypothetical protein